MPFVPYTTTRKAEVVALARLVGAEEAGRRTGINITTIRRWSQAAGLEPDIDPDTLAAAANLALARITDEIASGRLSGTKLAVAAGILQDKVRLRDRDLPRSAPIETALAARDRFDDWVVEHHLAESLSEASKTGDYDAELGALEALHGELLSRANAEPGQSNRRALLAWFSGRTTDNGNNPILAGDVVPWAQRVTERLVARYGPLPVAVARCREIRSRWTERQMGRAEGARVRAR